MAAPVLQFKRGLLANLPGLRGGEPGFTTDSYDLYVGIDSTTNNNKFFGSHRYWTRETTTTGSGINLVEGTDNGTDYLTIKSPNNLAGIVTYVFPGIQGAVSSVLTNDGNGNLTWASGSANPVFTGIATFTGTTDNTLGNADTGAVQIDGGLGVNKNVTIGAGLSVTGVSHFIGTATFYGGQINLGDSDTDDIVVGGEFASNLIPTTDDLFSLGSSSNQWKDLFINGTADIDALTVSGVSTFSSSLLGTQANFTGIATAKQLSNYRALVGAASSETETFIVTVENKTSNHRYFGSGSSQGYFIDGKESPFITLLPGKTYRFDQADASNSSHPILFYFDANRTTQYTTNVTTTGTAGNAGAYVEITITDLTPIVLHYQCSNHAGMGNAISNYSNFINTPYSITTLGGLSVTGVSTLSGQLNANGGITVDTNAFTVADTTGNTSIAGTLAVTGTTTLTGLLDANGGAEIDNIRIGVANDNEIDTSTGNLTIDSAGGTTTLDDNVSVSGTLGVTGATTLSSTLAVTGATTLSSTLGVTDAVVVGTSLSAPTIKTATIQHSSGTQAAAIDSSGNITASQNLTIAGNLFVNGSTTQVNTAAITVEDRTIELGVVDGNAPTSATTWDLGVLFNYHATTAKKSAVIWEHGDARFKFASVLAADTDGSNVNTPQLTVTTFAPIEIASLFVNDCAGQSQVISCTGSTRNLENITIDGGSF